MKHVRTRHWYLKYMTKQKDYFAISCTIQCGSSACVFMVLRISCNLFSPSQAMLLCGTHLLSTSSEDPKSNRLVRPVSISTSQLETFGLGSRVVFHSPDKSTTVRDPDAIIGPKTKLWDRLSPDLALGAPDRCVVWRDWRLGTISSNPAWIVGPEELPVGSTVRWIWPEPVWFPPNSVWEEWSLPIGMGFVWLFCSSNWSIVLLCCLYVRLRSELFIHRYPSWFAQLFLYILRTTSDFVSSLAQFLNAMKFSQVVNNQELFLSPVCFNDSPYDWQIRLSQLSSPMKISNCFGSWTTIEFCLSPKSINNPL